MIMFNPTIGPGQITKKDCWISATIIGIYMAFGEIPNIIIDSNKVIINKDIEIELMSKPKSNLEASIRALRVYFSKDSELYQKNMTLEHLEHYGSPDKISELLLNKKFSKYSCQRWSLSRIFYPYLSFHDLKRLLSSKNNKDIILCTFNFNPSHLYVVLELKERDIVSIIDISSPDLVIREISINEIYIIITLIYSHDDLE